MNITLFINIFSFSQELPPVNKPITPSETNDDVIQISPNETFTIPEKEVDSINNDSIKPKETLTDIVEYTADDYVKISRRKQQIHLYNNAEVIYDDMQINVAWVDERMTDNAENQISLNASFPDLSAVCL